MVTLPDQAERRSRSRFASRRATRRQCSGRSRSNTHRGTQCIVRIFTEDAGKKRKTRYGQRRRREGVGVVRGASEESEVQLRAGDGFALFSRDEARMLATCG